MAFPYLTIKKLTTNIARPLLTESLKDLEIRLRADLYRVEDFSKSNETFSSLVLPHDFPSRFLLLPGLSRVEESSSAEASSSGGSEGEVGSEKGAIWEEEEREREREREQVERQRERGGMERGKGGESWKKRWRRGERREDWEREPQWEQGIALAEALLDRDPSLPSVPDVLEDRRARLSRVSLGKAMQILGDKKRAELALEVYHWMAQQRGRLRANQHSLGLIITVLGRYNWCWKFCSSSSPHPSTLL